MCGSEARFFATPGLAQSGDGVFDLDQLLAQPTTLGYMYGGIFSTVGLTANQQTQTMATNALYKIVLVPNGGRATYTTLVDSLYQVLLGRSPTTAEQNYWVTWLNAGQSPTHVALAFIESTEHRTAELNYYFNEYLNAQLDSASEQFYMAEFAHGADRTAGHCTDLELAPICSGRELRRAAQQQLHRGLAVYGFAQSRAD